MSNTSLVLGMNWQLDEWPEYVDVLHVGDCDTVTYFPERTCEVDGIEYDDLLDMWFVELSCGHADIYSSMKPGHCSCCGAKVVE